MPTDTTWLTVTEAAAHADRCRRAFSGGRASIRPMAIRKWVSRGHLQARGMDAAGRQLFALADVAAAELATRGRALRLVGISAA